MSAAAAGIGLILLAAGGSRRLGRPKQLLPFRGRTLLRHAAETALASICRPVVAVLGAAAEELEGELAGLPLAVAVHPEWAAGLAGSLRAGLAALEGAAETPVAAAVVMLCDQPGVAAADLDALAAAWRAGGRPLVAALYGGELGVPALFDRSLFPELAALAGDAGAKRVLSRHREAAIAVPLPAAAFDVDTPDDLARLARLEPV